MSKAEPREFRWRPGSRLSGLVTTWIGVGLVAVLAVGAGALSLAALQPPHSQSSVDEPYVPSFVPKTVPPTVVYIGDSFVGGSDMGGRGKANWSRVASDEAGWTACALGVGGSGWTRGSNGWTFGARVDWALSRRPSMIVFANAVNDLKDGSDVGAAADLALADLRSKAPEIPVVIIGPVRMSPINQALTKMDNDLRLVAQSHGAVYISPSAEDWFDSGEAPGV